jgi:hypothetical protein
MGADGIRTIRLWRAAEMFSPRPLPDPDIRQNVADAEPGEPLPWEPGGRLAGRPAAPGRTWRHEVFGGIFRLGKVRGTLAGESALFTCTVSASGALLSGPAVSECAWAVGQLALGDEAAASGDPSSWLTTSSGAGRLPVARENLPDLPDGPLSSGALSRFAGELAELLGVSALLEPAGIRVRSYQTREDNDTGAYGEAAPLAGHFAADLARVSGALRESAAGLPLLTYLSDTGLSDTGPGERDDIDRVDIRRQPLTVRDGCAPDRTPPGRWPADAPLVLSEQFAVNEILGHDVPLSAVDAPPGGTAAVFNDLAAAIVTKRARALAGLSSPGAAFGPPMRWGRHSVASPAPALTGFEILVAAPRDVPGLSAVGTEWRERAADAGYFDSTARLVGGESWAMIRAHLGDAAECRAFTDRFWHGRVRGSEALFAAGEPMREQLRYAPAADWPGAVAGFRSALAEVDFLLSERKTAADTLTRFSALEQACEDAYSSLDEAQARVADLAAREPDTRASMIAAEERRRAALEDLHVHQGDRPGLTVSMSTGLRAGREWYAAHTELRAAFDTAARSRDEALGALQALRAEMAATRKMMADAHEAASRLATSMDALQAPVAAARKRWGDHVPEGPSYAETEDTALIERRENSAPWSDPEFAAARAGLFLAALTLHRSMIRANARVLEANLAAWADIVSGDGPAGRPPPEVTLAAWQSFFLVVPVVSVSFDAIGSLLAGLGRGSVGWLLAAGAGEVPPRHMAGALWRANRAVLAGTPASGGEEEESALSLAARATRFGTWLPDGTWTGLPLHPRPGAAVSPPVASPSGDTEMLRAVLSDLRQRARSRR